MRALTLRAEIGDITRFHRGGRELASYAGLVTRVDRSAHHCHYRGRITREGSPWLRYVLVEAAVNAMKRPDAIGPVGAPTHATQRCGNRARGTRAGTCGEIVRGSGHGESA